MIFTAILGHVLATGIGLSLGLVGGGGSILAVPILIYVMGIKTQAAIASSFAIVSVVSCIGAITHWTKGNINLRATAFFMPAAMVGSYGGAKLTALPFMTNTIQLLCFGIVMLVASLLMIRKGKQTSSPGEPSRVTPAQANSGSGPVSGPSSGVPVANESDDEATGVQQHGGLVILEGGIVGVLTGFAGIGGGFLITPVLVLLAGLPIKEAIGTSLLIISAKSITGFLGYLDHVTVDWSLILSFTVAASLGKVLGLYISQFLQARHLQTGLGYVVSVVAMLTLAQAIAF